MLNYTRADDVPIAFATPPFFWRINITQFIFYLFFPFIFPFFREGRRKTRLKPIIKKPCHSAASTERFYDIFPASQRDPSKATPHSIYAPLSRAPRHTCGWVICHKKFEHRLVFVQFHRNCQFALPQSLSRNDDDEECQWLRGAVEFKGDMAMGGLFRGGSLLGLFWVKIRKGARKYALIFLCVCCALGVCIGKSTVNI